MAGGALAKKRDSVLAAAAHASSTATGVAAAAAEADEQAMFDPRSPRANYSLYPLDHLLFCEDCHEIRCPRCVLEEIVCWFCPSCLLEVPSTLVRAEGNRFFPPFLSFTSQFLHLPPLFFFVYRGLHHDSNLPPVILVFYLGTVLELYSNLAVFILPPRFF
jgi:hypothetical protein